MPTPANNESVMPEAVCLVVVTSMTDEEQQKNTSFPGRRLVV